MIIKNNNISDFKTGIQIQTGLVDGNYIHAPGYVAGDHTNGIYINGGTAPLTIQDNTIFISLAQTNAISLDVGSSGVPVANKTIENNFLAGGGYAIYGGADLGNTTSNILIEGNRFGQLYYPRAASSVPSPTSTPPGRATSGRATSGTPPGRPFPPVTAAPPRCTTPAIASPRTAGRRSRRCGSRRRPLACRRHVRGVARRPVGPIQLAGPAGLLNRPALSRRFRQVWRILLVTVPMTKCSRRSRRVPIACPADATAPSGGRDRPPARNEVPLKARMLALKVALALIVFGGTAFGPGPSI